MGIEFRYRHGVRIRPVRKTEKNAPITGNRNSGHLMIWESGNLLQLRIGLRPELPRKRQCHHRGYQQSSPDPTAVIERSLQIPFSDSILHIVSVTWQTADASGRARSVTAASAATS